ncbi:DUF4139 domain-containing protein [Paracrocinitomix mangrovi]|uniref:DUF4139 domain-containing protein n=1 Tax=Paracrocinitomix mangrovi TaxID=2862509 RepID=UPI001C8D6F07|nr:DUF4139 domain-containing protein [Paracrocinitomix mangrovi]UKN01134.1 DUF4139 domain-containing protein [Paracrocinitomix mangrovi]
MKQFTLALSALILTQFSFGQKITETKISSDIKNVTVFITGGEITRNAKINVKKGRNKLIFKQISTVADHKSCQFTADKKLSLVSVSAEVDYISFVENNPRITTIRDSIEILGNKVIDLNNERSAYAEEKSLILSNKSIKGDQKNLTVEELRAMADFYRERIMSINKTLTKYDNEIKSYNDLKYKYQNQLSELNYEETIKSNQIIVIVDSDIDQTINTEIKYIVSNCGWQANYDLSAADVKGKINLTYKAKVYNNTGNDWNDVKLTLSTSDPNLSASAPVLSPWYLNYASLNQQSSDYYKGNQYVVPQKNEFKQYYQNANAPSQSMNLSGLLFDGSEQNFQNGANQFNKNPNLRFTTIEVSELSTEFEIDDKYTIPADSKPYLVEVADNELDATFSHKAVPKLDKDAFLLANIVGWEKLDLVPGPTNVYFADTYVGQSYINTRNVGDTLRLSFGRDNRIVITRKKLEEFSDKKVVGNNRKDNYVYEISIRNNREIAVEIDLFDQIPISQDSDIQVTVDETSEAIYNETTGLLRWKVNLQPGEVKKYKLGFTLKYPKDKKIQVKKYRSISAPSF